jgi:hypothetical protein
VIAPPRPDGAVALQRERVIRARRHRGDGGDGCQMYRRRALGNRPVAELAEVVGAERPDRPVWRANHGVSGAGRYGLRLGTDRCGDQRETHRHDRDTSECHAQAPEWAASTLRLASAVLSRSLGRAARLCLLKGPAVNSAAPPPLACNNDSDAADHPSNMRVRLTLVHSRTEISLQGKRLVSRFETVLERTSTKR